MAVSAVAQTTMCPFDPAVGLSCAQQNGINPPHTNTTGITYSPAQTEIDRQGMVANQQTINGLKAAPPTVKLGSSPDFNIDPPHTSNVTVVNQTAPVAAPPNANAVAAQKLSAGMGGLAGALMQRAIVNRHNAQVAKDFCAGKDNGTQFTMTYTNGKSKIAHCK